MRSLLFVPGDDAKKLSKAASIAADALILDLEDAVVPDRKAEARKLVSEFLRSADRTRQKLYVRINALDTGLALGDLSSVMPAHPDGIVLPKCRSSAQLHQLGHHLDEFESAGGRKLAATQILAIVTETADSVLALMNYGDCGPRLWGMMWGAEDLSSALGATETMDGYGLLDPYRLARTLCLLAASAAKVAAVDAVSTNLDDLSGFRREAEEGRRDGFTAKAVIHPKHVDVVNDVFGDYLRDVSWAERVVKAFAASPQSGAVQIDGKMYDRPHLTLAQKILNDTRSLPKQAGQQS
jgi:citrate lyase subunit beta/citryl-CoA lyase